MSASLSPADRLPPSSLQFPSLSRPHPAPTPPRSISIRFAPLPDPRAIRPLVPPHGLPEVWWAREEKPDGSWGEYRLLVRRPGGQVSPLEHIHDPHQRRLAIEASDDAQAPNHPLSSSPLPENTCLTSSSSSLASEVDPSRKPPSGPAFCLSADLPPSLSSPHPPLRHATSSDTISLKSCSSAGNVANIDHHRPAPSSSTSFTKKILSAVTKPLRSHPLQLTPSSSLPLDRCPGFGAPLAKSRSVESTLTKRFGFCSSLGLSRTRSRDERSSSINLKNDPWVKPTSWSEDSLAAPLEAERARRRAKYPPVAQRKVQLGASRGEPGIPLLSNEPAFVEWGAPLSRALVHSQAGCNFSKQASVSDDKLEADDDGSGLAWLKKRKREREERARQEAREEAKLSSSTSGPSETLGSVVTSEESPILTRDASSTRSASSETSSRISQTSVQDDGAPSTGNRSRRSSTSNTTTSNSSHPSVGLANETASTGSSSPSVSCGSTVGNAGKTSADEEEDLNDEELEEEERLKAKALVESPFLKGAKEVFKDREHHRVLKT